MRVTPSTLTYRQVVEVRDSLSPNAATITDHKLHDICVRTIAAMRKAKTDPKVWTKPPFARPDRRQLIVDHINARYRPCACGDHHENSMCTEGGTR